jgi:beta-lactamase superfamily II metal-dependent hydrolase
MAKKKKSEPKVSIKVGRRKVKVVWWVFLIIILVAAIAVGVYYGVKIMNEKKGDNSSSSEETTSQSVTTSETTSYVSGGDSLYVYALEQTGQYGDCTLFKLGNYEVLFDGGNTGSGPQLADLLKTYVTDHVLDLLVLTHPHTDHYGGFVNGTTANASGGTLADGGITGITKLIDNGADSYGTTYTKQWCDGVRSFFVGKGTQYQAITDVVSGHTYDAIWSLAANFQVQFLDTSSYPSKGSKGPTDANDGSVACDVRFGTYDFIMCGDLPNDPEEKLVTNYTGHSFVGSGNTVVYKACHHCSSTSNSAVFLKFLSPTYAFSESGIETGNETKSGPVKGSQHPYEDARARIEAYTGKDHIWWNGTCGTLTMTIPSDFSSFTIHGAGRKYGTYYANGVLVDPASEKDTPLEETQWATTYDC